MKTSELSIGDEVFVRLPYDGGAGWAEVLSTDSVPPPRAPKTATVSIRFTSDSYGSLVGRTYTVSPARIVKKRKWQEVAELVQHVEDSVDRMIESATVRER